MPATAFVTGSYFDGGVSRLAEDSEMEIPIGKGSRKIGRRDEHGIRRICT
jgi:hypothetical protein